MNSVDNTKPFGEDPAAGEEARAILTASAIAETMPEFSADPASGIGLYVLAAALVAHGAVDREVFMALCAASWQMAIDNKDRIQVQAFGLAGGYRD